MMATYLQRQTREDTGLILSDTEESRTENWPNWGHN